MQACYHATSQHRPISMPNRDTSNANASKRSKTESSDAGATNGTTMDATDLAGRVQNVPLQIRISKEEARRIKVAAAERDQTISQFLLSCFRAYLK